MDVRAFGCIGLAIAVLVAGCGDDGAPRERAGLPPSPLRQADEVGKSGTESQRACGLIRPAVIRRSVAAAGGQPPVTLVARPRDSLDLTTCDWHGRGVRGVRLIVDSAPSAQLRYFNQLSEQLEYHNADAGSGQRPVQIRGVGQDSAYGGAGAWWTPTRKQLVAYASQRIVRVRVVASGLDDRARRRVATQLARSALKQLNRD